MIVYLARFLNSTLVDSYGIWNVSQKKNLRAFSSSRRNSYSLISWMIAIFITNAPCHLPGLEVPTSQRFSLAKSYDQNKSLHSLPDLRSITPYWKILWALCKRCAAHSASITRLAVASWNNAWVFQEAQSIKFVRLRILLFIVHNFVSRDASNLPSLHSRTSIGKSKGLQCFPADRHCRE